MAMALVHVITSLLLALALAMVHPSTCLVLKGAVSCLDCQRHYDLSGIKVVVKCDQVKKLVESTTESDGSFETELPSDTPQSLPQTLNCLAKLLGGPNQLYASRNNMVSEIVKSNEPNSYTIATLLAFSTKCPLAKNDATKCSAHNAGIGSSKTIDIPLPREWGLAPSSYYVPFFPIIGIP